MVLKKNLVFIARIHRFLVRIANRENPDQRSSLFWVCHVYSFSKKNWFSELKFADFLSEKQTGKTLIRLLPQKQSNLGLPCLFVLKNNLVFRADIHKFLVRIANREDPDQTASSEAVCSGSAMFIGSQIFFWFSELEFTDFLSE